jgi:hypothetical protein
LTGGGGTKVFCSQALKKAVATIAKPARRIVALFCAAAPHDFERAGEREAFIFRAPIGFVLEKAYSEIGFLPPHENSNNPLAAEPESENDATRFFIKTLSISHFGWSGGFRHGKRIYSNDQDIDARENAASAADGSDIRDRGTRISAGADPGAT